MVVGQPPRRRRAGLPRSPHHRFKLTLLIIFGFVFSGAAGIFAYFLPALTVAFQDTGQTVGSLSATPGNTSAGSSPLPSLPASSGSTSLPSSGPFTILLLGSDNDAKFSPDHVLTQSMILVRVDPETKQVTMLSLPRDLWVPIATGGSAKIDAAYSTGGPAGAIATVEEDFHVKIDGYVWIGLQGLTSLIDQMNGVDVVAQMPVLDNFYPADLSGGNPYALERVAVLPGPQYLNGASTLQYARSRHGSLLEDIARNQRQQEVLLDLKAKDRLLNVTDIPNIATSLGAGIHTSIPLTQVISLLPIAQAMSKGNVHTIVMVYSPYYQAGTIDGQDVLIPNWSSILSLVHQYFPDTSSTTGS